MSHSHSLFVNHNLNMPSNNSPSLADIHGKLTATLTINPRSSWVCGEDVHIVNHSNEENRDDVGDSTEVNTSGITAV